MSARRAFPILIPVLLTALAVLAGCRGEGDATAPPADAASIDPGAGSFRLETLTAELPDGALLPVTLVGADLVLDADGRHVQLAVALRNDGERPLPAPAVVWLTRFDPAGVFVAAPDTSLPVAGPLPVDGFVYDDELGPDGALPPGAASAPRTWRFLTPAQEPFSFALRLAPPSPPAAAIAGRAFYDHDRDGLPGDDERPLAPGHVDVAGPDGLRAVVPVDADGRYAYPLAAAGLYELTFVPEFETFAPLLWTTPNPLRVLITPDPDGRPLPYDRARFGAVTDAPPPQVIGFTDAPPDSLHHAPWMLVEAQLREPALLQLHVGYSGCQPAHDFRLWMSGGFMESEPVRARIVLVHETEEACDAAFETVLPFGLEPLAERYRESYGEGPLLLEIVDFQGRTRSLLWNVGG
jgi:hypothetical protein